MVVWNPINHFCICWNMSQCNIVQKNVCHINCVLFSFCPNNFWSLFPQEANFRVGLLFILTATLNTLKEGILVLQPMHYNTGYWLFEQTEQIFLHVKWKISPRDRIWKINQLVCSWRKHNFCNSVWRLWRFTISECHCMKQCCDWTFCVWSVATLFATHNTHFSEFSCYGLSKTFRCAFINSSAIFHTS